MAQTSSRLRQSTSSISPGSVQSLPCSLRTPRIGGRRPKIERPMRKWSASALLLLVGPVVHGAATLARSCACSCAQTSFHLSASGACMRSPCHPCAVSQSRRTPVGLTGAPRSPISCSREPREVGLCRLQVSHQPLIMASIAARPCFKRPMSRGGLIVICVLLCVTKAGRPLGVKGVDLADAAGLITIDLNGVRGRGARTTWSIV